MLIYHPAFDIYHGAFRLLRLLEALPRTAVEVDRLRILDFYLLFPALLREVRFPIGEAGAKNYFKKLPPPYEEIDDPKALFMRLEPLQRAALEGLAASALIHGELLQQDKVQRSDVGLPVQLHDAIVARNRNSKEVQFLTGPLYKLDLYGKSGLKQRSDLFEHRYDPA
jgi:hypothetical protein